MPIMRRVGDLAFIASLRDALPWSFIGLAAAFLGILISELANGTFQGNTLGLRVASALLPAFGVMAATLVVILPLRLARATHYAAAPLLLGSVGGFALALPQPFGPDPITYLRLVGTTGLFVAMLACGVTAAWMALARRHFAPALSDWLGALLAVGTFGALIALHVSLPAAIASA
ncbi:MAG: hypothetical protein ABSF08_07645, partial [Candidatus Cybelea sp.]